MLQINTQQIRAEQYFSFNLISQTLVTSGMKLRAVVATYELHSNAGKIGMVRAAYVYEYISETLLNIHTVRIT